MYVYIKRHSDSEMNYFMLFLESQFFFFYFFKKKGKKKAGRDHKLYNIREKGEEIKGIRREESIVMFGKMER